MGGSAMGQLAQAQTDKGSPTRRRVHSIRFADDEWGLIADAAKKSGIQPAQFVRDASIEEAQNPT